MQVLWPARADIVTVAEEALSAGRVFRYFLIDMIGAPSGGVVLFRVRLKSIREWMEGD